MGVVFFLGFSPLLFSWPLFSSFLRLPRSAPPLFLAVLSPPRPLPLASLFLFLREYSYSCCITSRVPAVRFGKGVPGASSFRAIARVGMCDGEVPRGRRACVKSGSADGVGRAPNLTAVTAQAFSDLIWWFYNQSGKEAVYLRGITECTVLAFRLCATGLGLPWVASPSVSEDVRRHGAYHYLRMDLATSALQAAVLRGESVPAAMFSRSHYSTLQAWLPASDRRRWPYHRCCYSRGPTGAPLPKVKVVASASGVADGGVSPEGPDPPPQARLGVRDARLRLGVSSSLGGARALVSGPARLVRPLRPPLSFPPVWLPHLLPPESDKRVRLRDEGDTRDLRVHVPAPGERVGWLPMGLVAGWSFRCAEVELRVHSRRCGPISDGRIRIDDCVSMCDAFGSCWDLSSDSASVASIRDRLYGGPDGSRWGLPPPEVLPLGEEAAVNFSLLGQKAVHSKGSLNGRGGGLRTQAERWAVGVSSLLRKGYVKSPTADLKGGIYLVRRGRFASPLEYAALMGYGPYLDHLFFRSLASLASPALARCAIASGVHLRALRPVMEVAGLLASAAGQEVTVGFTGAGANLAGVAFDAFFGADGWTASFLDEWEAGASRLLHGCWGERWPAERFFGAAHLPEGWVVRPEVAVWLVTLRCQPWSYANVLGHKDQAAAVRELDCVYQYLACRSPLLVCHEVPLDHLEPGKRGGVSRASWDCAEYVFDRASGGRYVWARLLTDPSRQEPREPMGRARALYVGVRATALKGLGSVSIEGLGLEGARLLSALLGEWRVRSFLGGGRKRARVWDVERVVGGRASDVS